MNSFASFLQENKSLLLFGLLLTFFSSFGQTFLISLYLPSLEAFFQMTNTALSGFYAIATSASALSLPWIGRLVDSYPLKRFTLIVIVGLACACLFLSFAIHPMMILLGFWGLRLFGQGLMSHTSISTMARAFVQNRGKAISLASLGHPLGEASLPLLITILIGSFGWQSSLQISFGFIVILLLPVVLWLMKQLPEKVLYPVSSGEDQPSVAKNPLKIMTLKSFWIITPAVFILGFFNTALFFFQLKLGMSRAWTPTWVAGSLSVYALASALSMMSAGGLVDKFTAKKLFPLMLIPYLIGVCLLASFEFPLIYPITLVLLAISNGAGGVIKNALFAEIYGTSIIGTVRSVFTTVMVLSTALGPLCFGILLDAGWSFSQVFWLFSIIIVLIIFWSWRLR